MEKMEEKKTLYVIFNESFGAYQDPKTGAWYTYNQLQAYAKKNNLRVIVRY